ncbi:hypothetical protein [Thiothrix unzii]|jgi:hypothetical protein|uniref:hypothetical protein n=1 Tax=Thiothrix unzii TaxID=111769 RepID=UPI002A35F88C|nr:hypothetical protein [Thiothrix unzii]MDX9989790.1 hypothetical protein [Thiothrix unzii]
MLEDSFIKEIEHAPCMNGCVEALGHHAYKIDGGDGLSENIGFNNGTLSNVDYFCKRDNDIQLIELSDLINSINECNVNMRSMLIDQQKKKGKKLSSTEEKKIRKKAWFPITSEFSKKWSGSIAVIERLYRKNKVLSDDPNYHMLIICKNNTDIIMLDSLKTQLIGMIRSLRICTTENASENLLAIIKPKN